MKRSQKKADYDHALANLLNAEIGDTIYAQI